MTAIRGQLRPRGRKRHRGGRCCDRGAADDGDTGRLVGTNTDLLSELGRVAGERQQRWKFWPGNAKALSNRLRRAKPGLRNVGITFEVAREGHERTRVIHITTKPDKEAMRLPATAASSTPPLNPNRDGDFDADRLPT